MRLPSRRTTLATLGTLALLVGCDKAKDPVATDVPAPAAQQAPAVAVPTVPTAPVATAPVRQSEPAPVAVPARDDVDVDDRAVPRHPVYADYRPPLAQPQPIAAPWAPPPLLGEAVPPQPFPDATWTGGYWVWRDQWVWAPGHWSRPPRPDYHWVPPYYEHRNDRVVFVDGFWSAPGVSFVRPALTLSIALAVVGAGVAIGRPPVGPEGPFLPPPPGSRWGLIVPAPVGTSPFVVRGAPPIVAPGMRVTNNVTRVDNDVHNTTIDRRSTTVINHVTNVTIEAPASATSNHQAVHAVVAPQSHLVAGVPAIAAPPNAATPPARTISPPVPAPGRIRPPAAARPGGAPDRDRDQRRPEAMRPPVDATRPVPHAEMPVPAPAPAPAPRPTERAPEPTHAIDRDAAHAVQQPAQRPAATTPTRPQPAPAKAPEAARAVPPHAARPGEPQHPPQHPPAHQAAQPPKEHPPAAAGGKHGEQQAPKEKRERHE